MPYEGLRRNADCYASYTPLADGSFGAWINDTAELRRGQKITVTTKGGSTRPERLDTYLHTTEDGQYQLWTLLREDR